MLELIGFDADDTLWHSEPYFFQDAHACFERILGGYIDLADARVHERLLATERRNIKLFGYGAKGMTLSLIETAVELTDAAISGRDVQALIELGKGILTHPVELLPGARAAVAQVAERHKVVLITKGDLFHQEAKVRDSGLADLFHRIEIVSEKDPATYARLFEEFGLDAARFAMVGNSLRSDIEPVLALGGAGVHVPYAITWAHEAEHAVDAAHPRLRVAASLAQVPSAIAELSAA